jgi:hypothetical protein
VETGTGVNHAEAIPENACITPRGGKYYPSWGVLTLSFQFNIRRAIMNTKKSIIVWVFMGIFVISSWLILSDNSAQAQSTMKFKIVNNIVKTEFIPFPDEKGHAVGVLTREGLVLFENGEVGKQLAALTVDIRGNTVTYDAITTIIFPDESSWVLKSKGIGERSPDGKLLPTKQTGDFVRGTGKYEGIKGTVTIIGTQYGLPEAGRGHWIAELTATYTLPSK